jgi:hypothetical protein
MNRYEQEIKAIDEAMLKHVHSFEAIYKKEQDEDRKLTEDERLEVEQHVKAIEVLKSEKKDAEANLATVKEVGDIGRKLGPAVPSIKVGDEPHDRMFQHITKTLGEQFTDSAAYKATIQRFKEAGGGPISTGAVPLEMKGTLGEAPGSGGGAYVSVPQVIPGVVDKLFQPLTFADLILSGQANTTSLRYVVEGTATSGAREWLRAAASPSRRSG